MENEQNNLRDGSWHIKVLGKRIEIIEKHLGLAGDDILGSKSFNSKKCGSSLNKGELVHLFHTLMDEGLLFFHPADPKSNRTRFQNFIQENFTYLGEGGAQHGVKGVSRHFSECMGFSYRDKQIRHLEKIIEIFTSRKDRLEDR